MSYLWASGTSGWLDRQRSAAVRTLLVASSTKAALTGLLVAGFVVGGGSLLFAAWPVPAQLAVLAVIATNVLLLRRLCRALHAAACASLRELAGSSPEWPQ